MTNRIGKFIVLFSVLIIIAVFSLYIWLPKNTSKVNYNTDIGKTSFNADFEIESALKKLTGSVQKSSVIDGVDTLEKVTAITFEGMVDQKTGERLLKLLDSYNVKSVFFIPGIKAAEDPDTVKMISDSGQAIGNYTLNADKQMEQFSNMEMIKNLNRTSVILRDITGKAPTLLKCNLTEYTNSLLRTADASGLKAVVDNNYFLNYQSFSSKENAANFVKSMARGSIISIKLNSVLDKSEYDKGKKTDEKKTAVDPKPSLSTKNITAVDKNEKLIEAVGYLLDALQNGNYKIVSLDNLASFEDLDLSRKFDGEKVINKGKLAGVYKRLGTKSQSVAYSFRGIENEAALDRVLEILKEKNIQATFFVTGNEAVDYPDRVKKILKAGHLIGNGGLTGASLEKMSYNEVCIEIYKCNKLLKEKFQVSTNLFMPAYGKYNDIVREAASSLNYDVVTYSIIPVQDNNDSVDKIKKLGISSAKGDIIYLWLDYHDILKEVEVITKQINEAGKGIVSIAALMKGTNIADNTAVENSTGNNTMKVDTAPGNYQAKRILNLGKKAELITRLYTSQPSVAYVFRGISDREALDNVLQTLDNLHAKATFFITGKEIIKYKASVDEIVRRGHQIGNGGYGMNTSNPGKLDFKALCYEIDMGERYLRSYLGNSYDEAANKYYMPFYADAGGAVLEAAKTLGYDKVVTYNVNAMTSKFRDLPADQIVKEYFANTVALQRGDIVYFRLDYLTKKNAISDLVYKTAEGYVKKATYDISTVGDMLTSKLVYAPSSRTQAKSSDLIRSSYNYSKETLFSYITGNYIGNPYISTNKRLIDFSDEEIPEIDTAGKIETNGQKVIFLTFDDWGYDNNVTHLLNVLKKYNVKATFFVRVGNDSLSSKDPMENPNLLRAIALDGHDIGSHTYSHMKVNISSEEEKLLLQEDLVSANQEMARYIGDTGSLKLFFRPPTLEVSKLGLETVFDSGYKYIINGDFSTHDYEAKSAQHLINIMINGMNAKDPDQEVTQDTLPQDILKIGPGSIVVMHMSENAVYTPEALDKVIPYYLENGYQFARLSDYLANGYRNPITKTSP